jgi:hypothetical protein
MSEPKVSEPAVDRDGVWSVRLLQTRPVHNLRQGVDILHVPSFRDDFQIPKVSTPSGDPLLRL